MNKKGGIYLAVAMAIMLFLVGMLVIPFIKDSVTNFRTNINCTNTSISDGAKLTCLAGDTVVPYFIITVIAIAGGIIFREL